MTSLCDHQVVVTGASFVRADSFDSEQQGAQEFESYNHYPHPINHVNQLGIGNMVSASAHFIETS